jgi:hypothetical protein
VRRVSAHDEGDTPLAKIRGTAAPGTTRADAAQRRYLAVARCARVVE